jgi:predicted dehydrogenase
MPRKRALRVGLIGYKFMGKAHSNAWRQAPRFFDLGTEVRMKTICGRDKSAAGRAAMKLGWDETEVDWRRVVADPQIDIVDICTPNDTHCEISIAAAKAGKAILCEKPLGRTIAEAKRMTDAVRRAGVANMVCHNYRRIPAIALAKEMIERGEIGDRIFHCRARYAQDWIVDPNFPLVWRLQSGFAGSGALGDIFSHIVDLSRYLVGEVAEICGTMQTFIKKRPLEKAGQGARGRRSIGNVAVDDAVTAIGRFQNGALLSLEATRFAPGRKNSITLEINGSKGSLYFDLEEMNRLKVFSMRDPKNRQGFRDIIVTESSHPYMKHWWPPGHIIGYEHTFTHTVADFVKAVVSDKPAQPDFSDGLRTQRVLDAVAQSAHNNRWISIGK